MVSAIGLRANPEPRSTNRRTKSDSVRIPARCAPSTTGRQPILFSRSIPAARAEALVRIDRLDLGRHDLAHAPAAQDLLLRRERQTILGAENAAGQIALGHEADEIAVAVHDGNVPDVVRVHELVQGLEIVGRAERKDTLGHQVAHLRGAHDSLRTGSHRGFSFP